MAYDDPYTAEDFYEYFSALGKNNTEKIKTIAPVSDDYARAIAYNSADMINWLGAIGLDLKVDKGSNAHSLKSLEDGLFGEQLVRALKQQLDDKKVEVRTGNKATELILKDGKIEGVKVATKNGDYNIYTNYVVICTGGYGGGEEALEAFAPSRLGYVCTAAVSSTGDGLFLAHDVGAALANIEAITYRTIATGNDNTGGAIGLHNAVNAGAIYVNQEGNRFINEAGNAENVVLAIQGQTNGIAYVLMDDTTMAERFKVSALYIPGTYETIFSKYETLDELAKATGINLENLKNTLTNYGQAVAAGKDSEFDRDKFMTSDFSEGPYYICSGKPSNHICAGGIVTNGSAQVLTESGDIIPGLYAAGETVNMAYHPLCNAMTGGIIAAKSIADEIAK